MIEDKAVSLGQFSDPPHVQEGVPHKGLEVVGSVGGDMVNRASTLDHGIDKNLNKSREFRMDHTPVAE
jgi:hypothetical protein